MTDDQKRSFDEYEVTTSSDSPPRVKLPALVAHCHRDVEYSKQTFFVNTVTSKVNGNLNGLKTKYLQENTAAGGPVSRFVVVKNNPFSIVKGVRKRMYFLNAYTGGSSLRNVLFEWKFRHEVSDPV